MSKEIEIDVEVPHKEVITIPWSDAAGIYELNEDDLVRLKRGEVVWVDKVALTLHEDD